MSTPSPLNAFSSALADLVRGAAPSVVAVKSERAESSGFVWRPGLVVAAEDALADDGEIEIVAHDGASARAELVGRDPSTDVALLRLPRTDLPQAQSSSGAPAAGALALVVAAREGAPAASLGIVSYAGPQWRKWLKPSLEILAGVPTVVYGFFAALTIGPIFRNLGEAVGLSVASESALAAMTTCP